MDQPIKQGISSGLMGVKVCNEKDMALKSGCGMNAKKRERRHGSNDAIYGWALS
jgi:hypothetical protein